MLLEMLPREMDASVRLLTVSKFGDAFDSEGQSVAELLCLENSDCQSAPLDMFETPPISPEKHQTNQETIRFLLVFCVCFEMMS